MSAGFYKLRIKELRRETPECVSVSFDIPEDIRTAFAFIQGQHLTLRTLQDGHEIRRSYSICSCPGDEELRIAVKKIEGGAFSSYMNEKAKTGDELDVMVPQGNFYTQLDPAHRKRYVAVAAGSGITPVISIIKSILKQEPGSKVTLLYGNRSKSSIIFKEEIEALKNQYIDRFSVYHILSREQADAPLLAGRIDKEKIQFFMEHLIDPGLVDEIFLCGPEEMIFQGRDAFSEAGVDPGKIHFELFYSAEAEARKTSREQRAVQNPGGPVSRILLRLDAASLSFELPREGNSILEEALRHGADLPYSCKGGVCATCKCKLEEGEVSMDVNYALEPDELEQGFILACQSHPLSERVVVNFDIK